MAGKRNTVVKRILIALAVVFVVLAAFFHIPALVFLPAYWIVM